MRTVLVRAAVAIAVAAGATLPAVALTRLVPTIVAFPGAPAILESCNKEVDYPQWRQGAVFKNVQGQDLTAVKIRFEEAGRVRRDDADRGRDRLGEVFRGL